MFNVTRLAEAPECLSHGNQYNHEQVVNALKRMFFEKCYLCERNDIQDVEVEHFNPQQAGGGRTDWNNLYYSCSRCNSLKSNTHTNLLDCTDTTINISRKIRLVMTVAPDDDVLVEATDENPCEQTQNTVRLLNECYNSTNTALRGVSREALIEQIYEYMIAFMTARNLLKKPSTGRSIKEGAIETIEAMLSVEHPFSTFWRWQYLHDSFLTARYPELEELF
ncbi:HNH endonuclease [Aliivibrio fischeri]